MLTRSPTLAYARQSSPASSAPDQVLSSGAYPHTTVGMGTHSLPRKVRSLSILPTEGRRSDVSMDWKAKAGCLDEDPELFFPIGTTGAALDQIDRAKAVCRQCKAITQCLDWAMERTSKRHMGRSHKDERRSWRRAQRRRSAQAEKKRDGRAARKPLRTILNSPKDQGARKLSLPRQSPTPLVGLPRAAHQWTSSSGSDRCGVRR
jgi:WhiB family redox-sensing transcriptional regulator